MPNRENIDPNHRLMGPLLEGDQAIVDAVEQIQPGVTAVRATGEFGRNNWNGPEEVYKLGRSRYLAHALAPVGVSVDNDGIYAQVGTERARSGDEAYSGLGVANITYETDRQKSQDIKKKAAAAIVDAAQDFDVVRKL